MKIFNDIILLISYSNITVDQNNITQIKKYIADIIRTISKSFLQVWYCFKKKKKKRRNFEFKIKKTIQTTHYCLYNFYYLLKCYRLYIIFIPF